MHGVWSRFSPSLLQQHTVKGHNRNKGDVVARCCMFAPAARSRYSTFLMFLETF